MFHDQGKPTKNIPSSRKVSSESVPYCNYRGQGQPLTIFEHSFHKSPNKNSSILRCTTDYISLPAIWAAQWFMTINATDNTVQKAKEPFILLCSYWTNTIPFYISCRCSYQTIKSLLKGCKNLRILHHLHSQLPS